MIHLFRCIFLIAISWNICYSQELSLKNEIKKFLKTEEDFSLEYTKAYQKSNQQIMEYLIKKYPYWAEEYIRKLLTAYLSFFAKDRLNRAQKYIEMAKSTGKKYKAFFGIDFLLKEIYYYENLSKENKKKTFQAILLCYQAKITQDSIYLFSVEKKYQRDLLQEKIPGDLKKIFLENGIVLSPRAFIIKKKAEWVLQNDKEGILQRYLFLETQKEIAVYHIDLYKEALQILEKIKDPFLTVIMATKLGEQFYSFQEFFEAEKYFEQAKNGFEKIQDEYSLAKVLNFLGMTAFSKKEYPLALSYYKRALGILKKKEHPILLASIFNNLGLLKKAQGNYSSAKKYWEQSLSIYIDLLETKAQMEILANLGLISYLQKEYPKAVQYLERCYNLSRILNKEKDILSHLGLLSTIKEEMGDHKKSVLYLEEKLEIAKKQNNTSIIIDSLSNLARLSVIQGQNEKAKKYYQQKLAILKDQKDEREIKEIKLQIAQLEKKEKLQYLLWGFGILLAVFFLAKIYKK